MASRNRREFLAEMGKAATLGGLSYWQSTGQNPPHAGTAESGKAFLWPNGKRAALSLSFDDARVSQVDVGLDLLNKCGVKATFCVVPKGVKERLEGWKWAVASGHEIGNHTMTHPCTGNYDFSFRNALENYSRDLMARDIDEANVEIHHLLGVTPTTFAYPCGEMFIGRGRQAESYVPLVADRFMVGLGQNDDWTTDQYEPVLNNPESCDLAQVYRVAFGEMGTMDFEHMVKLMTKAADRGRWLVFLGHEFGNGGPHVTDVSVLQALCQYAVDPPRGIWVDTVEHIGRYIQQERAKAA